MVLIGVKSAAHQGAIRTRMNPPPPAVDSVIMNTEPHETTSHAIFLDVDGTYADYGVVPAAHVQAVRDARAAGHKVFICTGRPMAMLPGSILGAGFDGIVASAGAYVEFNGEILVNNCFPADLATRALAELDAHDCVYILESPEAVNVPAAAKDRLLAHIAAHYENAPAGQDVGASSIIGRMQLLDQGNPAGFAKISVFESPIPMSELVNAIGPDIDVVANSIAAEGPHAGELFQRGISKADGVAAALAHLGMAQADSIAFGDGQNDLEMIAYAGLGVAIEGSSPELLALADRTALPPSRNGIAKAFAELGLI